MLQLAVQVVFLSLRNTFILSRCLFSLKYHTYFFHCRSGYARSIAGLKIESPLILGRECSGVIEKVGANVWHFKVCSIKLKNIYVILQEGDEVVAATAPFRQGSHAEYLFTFPSVILKYICFTFKTYIAVDESEIARKPKNLPHMEAASLPFTSLTAWNAISIAKIGKGTKLVKKYKNLTYS